MAYHKSVFKCDLCGRELKTKAALGGHKYVKHGLGALPKRPFYSTTSRDLEILKHLLCEVLWATMRSAGGTNSQCDEWGEGAKKRAGWYPEPIPEVPPVAPPGAKGVAKVKMVAKPPG